MTSDRQEAIQAWRSLLGAEAVLVGEQVPPRLRADTAPASRSVAAVLRISAADQLPEVMRIAQRHNVPVHPISTESTWGYGSAQPVQDGVALIDLSRLQRIIDFDPELGVVTVEPGVTQGMLASFLDTGGHAFMVPTTGAGPNVGLVSSALERGYGVTPYTDHFGALTDLEAVLADGSVYRGALREAGGDELSRLFKWGIGPYVDGLFTQSGFGVVTRASILLAKRPDTIKICLFTLANDALLEPAIERIREILQMLPGTVGGINLMDRRRMLALAEPNPTQDQLDVRGFIPDDLVAALGAQHQISPWTGVATLYGRKGMVDAAQREIRRALRGVANRVLFLSSPQVASIAHLGARLPGSMGQKLRHAAATLRGSMQIVQGRPSETTLPLVSWRSKVPNPSAELDPSQDRCGLLWYAPLVPMRPTDARRFVQFATKTLSGHGIEPLLTLTACDGRLIHCTAPLLFDAQSQEERGAAHRCLNELVKQGQSLGFYPNRFHVDAMAAYSERHPLSGAVVDRLRRALDPNEVLAPVRYR